MTGQTDRARLLEELRQAEARLREIEAAYIECKHKHGAGPECTRLHQAMLAANHECDRIFDSYLATDHFSS